MIVFFGTRLFGKCDHVPGLFHVATRFFYVQFLPLIPLGSYLVLDGTTKDGGGRGARIGLSGTSVLLAWLRAALWIAGGVAVVIAFLAGLELDRHRAPDWHTVTIALAVAAAAPLTVWASYRWPRPGPLRALRLASQAGLPPEAVAAYYADKLTPSELEELAQACLAAREAPTGTGEYPHHHYPVEE